jgi:hypothetical protein
MSPGTVERSPLRSRWLWYEERKKEEGSAVRKEERLRPDRGELEAGSWELEAGSWELEAGSWVQSGDIGNTLVRRHG